MEFEANVALPIPNVLDQTEPVDAFLRKEMLYRKAYSLHFKHNGQWWTRCSAAVYNEVGQWIPLLIMLLICAVE
jgi:hypothetical protein